MDAHRYGLSKNGSSSYPSMVCGIRWLHTYFDFLEFCHTQLKTDR
jgi:hypothetical protein